MSQIPVRTAARAGVALPVQRRAKQPVRRTNVKQQPKQTQPQSSKKLSDQERAVQISEQLLRDKERNLQEAQNRKAQLEAEGRTDSNEYRIALMDISRRQQIASEYRQKLSNAQRDAQRVRAGEPTAKQQRSAESRKPQTIQTDEGTVEVFRRSAVEGGSYTIVTPEGRNIPTRITGGSTELERTDTLLGAQQESIRTSLREGVSPATLRKEVSAIEQATQRRQELIRQEQYRKVARTFAEDFVKQRERFSTEQMAQQINISLGQDQTKLTGVVKEPTQFNAEAPFNIYATDDVIRVGDPEFYTIEGQKEALGRIPKAFEVLGKGTANIPTRVLNLVRDDKPVPFPLTPEQSDPATSLFLNPVTVAAAPFAAVPSTAAAVGGIVTIGVGGFGVVSEGGEIVQDVRFGVSEFRKENRLLAKGASAAGMRAIQEDIKESSLIQRGVSLISASGLSYITDPDASYTGGLQTSPQQRLVSEFVGGGTQYLIDRGVTGEDLEKARLGLAAEAIRLPAAEGVGIIGAEVAGNIGGRSLARSAVDILLPDEAVAVSATERGVVSSMRGGIAEGGAVVTYFDLLETGEISPTRTVLGAGTGALLAGGIEFFRTSRALPRPIRATAGAGAVIIEPQELVADVLQGSVERAGRTGRRVGRVRTPTPASDSLTNLFTDQPSFSTSSGIPARQVGVGVQTPAQVNTNIQQIGVNVQVPTNVLTTTTTNVATTSVAPSVLTTTQTKSRSETTSRTLTPSFLPPPPIPRGGFGGFVAPRQLRGTKRGVTRSLAADIFGLPKGLNISSSRKSSIGVASGLGLRL